MSLSDALAQERRARLAAERLLDAKQAELFAANKTLSCHALALSDEIVEKREEVAVVRTEAEELRGHEQPGSLGSGAGESCHRDRAASAVGFG